MNKYQARWNNDNRQYQQSGNITLADYARDILRPSYINSARELMSEYVEFKVTTIVWFGGRYRAMPH